MRGTRRTTWTWLLGMVFACGIGFGAGALQREAHAQSVATSTIYAARDTGSKGFVLDDDDPWKVPVTPRARPGAGF